MLNWMLLSAFCAVSVATTFECDNITVDKHTFDLSSLSGPHSVITTLYEPPSHSNITYTLDICNPLNTNEGDGEENKEACPPGTRVCAIKRVRNDIEDRELIGAVIPIAGDLSTYGGSGLDSEVFKLPLSAMNSFAATNDLEKRVLLARRDEDIKKDGLRLIFNGGAYPLDSPKEERLSQRLIIDFLCDATRSGLEGEWATSSRLSNDIIVTVSDNEQPHIQETQLRYDNTSLLFQGYREEEGDALKTLYLTWYTEHACRGSRDEDDDGHSGNSSSGWGFLKWVFVLVFLGTTAYLIFGTWLNFNRYGSFGWDTVPHSDALRDIPFLLKDFSRKVLNTVQGAGSRGGYSAV